MSQLTADLRRGVTLLRLGEQVTLPLRSREIVVGISLLIALLGLAVATLSIGQLGIAVADLPRAITDVIAGTGSGKAEFVLAKLRGPRLLVAVGAGAALGLAGALFQSVTRNPLGSPDVIGVSAGASAGVAIVTLFAPGLVAVPLAAVIGAGVAVGLVAVSTGTGLSNPTRMVLAGIGVSALAYGVVYYVMYVLARDRATQIAFYLTGTLEARTLGQAATIWIVLALCLVALPWLATPLGLSEMGEEVAASLGVDAGVIRRRAVVISVLLAGGAVAVAGPISFIALTAPHICRLLARSGGPTLVLSALMGAVLLVTADVAVVRVPWFESLPVGILTLGIGGAYLGLLLISEWRKQ